MVLAIKKLVVITSLCLTFLALFDFSIYAGSDNFIVVDFIEKTTSKDVLEYFDYEDDYLIELVDTNEVNIFSGPLFNFYDREIYQSEILKDLGPLQLSAGFEHERLTTFAPTKAITGVGEEGTIIGLHVFHLDTVINSIDGSAKEFIVSTQDRLVTLGKSKLYNETICFDYVGVNYVLLAVKNPITFVTTKRIYKVTLKELATRNKLENMTINFFEEETESLSIEEFVQEIVGF